MPARTISPSVRRQDKNGAPTLEARGASSTAPLEALTSASARDERSELAAGTAGATGARAAGSSKLSVISLPLLNGRATRVARIPADRQLAARQLRVAPLLDSAAARLTFPDHGRQITEGEPETEGAAKGQGSRRCAKEKRSERREVGPETEEVTGGQAKLLRRETPQRAGAPEEKRSQETEQARERGQALLRGYVRRSQRADAARVGQLAL